MVRASIFQNRVIRYSTLNNQSVDMIRFHRVLEELTSIAYRLPRLGQESVGV